MEDQHPRRALTEEKPNRRPYLVAAGVALALTATGSIYALTRPDAGNDSANAATPQLPQNEPSAARQGCSGSATLAVDPAWVSVVQTAANSWAVSQEDDCNPIVVKATTTAQVVQSGLKDVQGWIPEDPVLLASGPSVARTAETTTLGSSPLVLAMPSEAYNAIGGKASGDTLRKMMTLESSWANFNHPDWGWFKLVLPNVNQTVSGAAGFNSLAQLTSRGAPPPTNPATASTDSKNMAKVEQRLVAQVPVDQVTNSLDAHKEDANARTPAGPRAGVTTLALAMDSDKGLRATWLNPTAGVSMALARTSDDENVKGFADWLATDEGKQALAKEGLVAGSQQPAGEALEALGLSGAAPVATANKAASLDMARQLLAAFSVRQSNMLLLDTSGSMAEPLGNTPGRRIDSVLAMTQTSWAEWPPGSMTGIMTFNASNDLSQRPQIKLLAPLHSDLTPQGAKIRAGMKSSMGSGLQVTGGTPLYEAILKGWQYTTANYQPNRVNRLVVVTDGSNQDSSSKVTLTSLLGALPPRPDSRKPVQLLLVALGPDADYAVLKQIADATGQRAVQVNSVQDLGVKMAQMLA